MCIRDRALDAARAQDRVVTLVRRHLPERAPEARRRLARVLARAGRPEHGLAVLTGAMRFRDPEDSYEEDGIRDLVRSRGLGDVYKRQVFGELEQRDAARLIEAMARAGDAGLDACHACAAVLAEPLATVARSVTDGTSPQRAWVAGLADAAPVRAWATRRDAAPDQQQLLIVVGKELRRCSGLVVLLDFRSMGGAVKDAFFLPDLVEARLAREVFAPMAELGVPSHPTSLRGAVAALRDGLELTDEQGWSVPSSARQNVRERIDRWVLGRLQAERGNRAAALEWFERAAEAPAPTVDAGRALLYDLASVLEDLGETARALAVFGELQADARGFRDVTARIERLSRAQVRG